MAELALAVLGESTPSGRPKPAPSRVFAFASLRGVTVTPWPRRRARRR